MESKLGHYINGKRVAVIGRSQDLLRLKQGEFLDNHDIVVRINNPIPYPQGAAREAIQRGQYHTAIIERFLASPSFVPAQYHQYIGSKCSIFIFNDAVFATYVMADDRRRNEFVSHVGRSCDYFVVVTIDPQQENVLKELAASVARTNHAVHVNIDPDIYYSTHAATGSSPNGGTLAVMLCSRHEFGSLYISGFSKTATNLSKSNVDGESTHDFKFIKSIVEDDPRITADSIMECEFKTIQ